MQLEMIRDKVEDFTYKVVEIKMHLRIFLNGHVDSRNVSETSVNVDLNLPFRKIVGPASWHKRTKDCWQNLEQEK